MSPTPLRPSLRRSLSVIVLSAVLGVTAFQGIAAALASPTISAYASNGWWAGGSISDSLNLNNGINPTGTLTFMLYGPDDQTCTAAPIFTTQKTVIGNGYYTSASFTTNRAGTYHWTASYSGDANNNSVPPNPCSSESQTVFVAKRNVNLNGQANPVAANGSITNTATLGMGVGPTGPTGTITFNLYGPDNNMCAGAPIFTSVKTVTANGTYTTDPYTPTAMGKYVWRLNYSGDANNVAAMTICSDTANHVSITRVSAGFSFTAGPAAVRGGDALTVSWSNLPSPSSNDWVALYAAGAPGWSLVVWSSTGGVASGSATLTVPAGTAPGSYEVRLRTYKTSVVTVS